MDTPEQLERRARAGEWLSPGEVAALTGAARKTVDRMLTRDLMRYRVKLGTGRHRVCHPEDVLRLLAERRRVRGEAPPEGV